jgi:hypothetical protein
MGDFADLRGGEGQTTGFLVFRYIGSSNVFQCPLLRLCSPPESLQTKSAVFVERSVFPITIHYFAQLLQTSPSQSLPNY